MPIIIPSTIEKVWRVEELKECVKKVGILPKVTSNKKITYYNYPMSFDIETTSFIDNGEKVGTMYIWTFAIGGEIVQGRTWAEFVQLTEFLSEWYRLTDFTRLVIYVHNLPFEFQFMHKYFDFKEVFSTKTRQPIRALTESGIEFRCSYKLSGYSLAKLADQLTEHKIRKMEGDLDYDKLRNCKTTLTAKELQYCYNDCLVVNAYIDEYIDRVGGIDKIPMTKTGEVRGFMRKECLYGHDKKKRRDQFNKYHSFIKGLTLTVDDYSQLKRAFAGGFTHANAHFVENIMPNVRSFDFTSSYPYVMVSEKFPMSSPVPVELKSENEFRFFLNNYCCIFDLSLRGVKPKVGYENYISKSKCWGIKNVLENNGRVVSADELSITVTELDFAIIEFMYDFDEMEIYNFKYFKKEYLPTEIVKCILDLYEKKTTLKDVPEKAIEYMQSKERVNSAYGMMVTDILKDKVVYSSDDWTTESIDKEEALNKYNSSTKRFLYYAWGVWVTAYARFNLFTAIVEMGNDYVYVDTDSIKLINYEDHKEYFEEYNKTVIEKLERAMKAHRLPFSKCSPKNIKGETKTLGVWDDEGTYTRFKTLGAKRYMTEKLNKKGELEVKITVSGLNKQKCVPYLQEKYGEDIFDAFDDELYIPADFTGKMIHTYIDNEFGGVMTDYQGNTAEYHELSGIHLTNADYSLSISSLFLAYLLGLSEMEVPE